MVKTCDRADKEAARFWEMYIGRRTKDNGRIKINLLSSVLLAFCSLRLPIHV